jgi:hypothetical protein
MRERAEEMGTERGRWPKKGEIIICLKVDLSDAHRREVENASEAFRTKIFH